MNSLYTTYKCLLPAGALLLKHNFDDPLQEPAEDGWTVFPHTSGPVHDAPTARASGEPESAAADTDPASGAAGDHDDDDREDAIAADDLRFLVRHRFVAATYRTPTRSPATASTSGSAVPVTVCVRVYLVPWDLPGSRGVLRVRDEDAVLRPGRRRLKRLFLRLRQDRPLWEGEGDGPTGESTPTPTPKFFWTHTRDNRTLLDIYNDLPSPAPGRIVEGIPGLRSTLYEYQLRTVSTMVARENALGSIDDPLYLPIVGVDGRTFYVLPATMEIVIERPRISSVPGGILCEELGTGKTVMILSLILATVNQLSSPEDAYHEQRTTLTPLALRHFQSPSAIAARGKLSTNHKVLRATGVPSLTELALHQCRIRPDVLAAQDRQEVLEQLRLWEPLRANVPFYIHTEPPRDVGYGAARGARSGADAPRIVYLSTATLVVVPDNLQLQWENEILKHTTDLLRVLRVRQRDELPDAPVLATDYDIILVSHSRFAKEAQKKAMGDLGSRNPCQCPPLPGTRVPSCRCSRRGNVSPLLQIRWKRLVVDEGHNAAEKRTDYAMFTRLLSVERRWIVTGTPTSNLLGLNFGSGSDLQYPDEDEDEDEEEDDEEDARSAQRQWHNRERPDFQKLGTMFGEFLMVMPFASDPKAFSTLVVNPLFSPDGPWPGDTAVLTQVMASVMVRHRYEDVEQEVRLPFLQHHTVLLDMDLYAVKTYNLIQATIAVNAVDSERKDQDYLFHPRNAGSLRELVANVSHTMFWHVVDSSLEERLKNAERCLVNLSERNGSAEDFELIRQSIFHLECAIGDPVWKALQAHYHAYHRVDKIPLEICRAWSMSPELIPDTNSSDTIPNGDGADTDIASELLMAPMVLMKMREFVFKHPSRSRQIENIVEMGRNVVEEELRWKQYDAALQYRKNKGSKDRRAKEKDELVGSRGKREAAEAKLQEMREEYRAAAARLASASAGEPAPSSRPEDGPLPVPSQGRRVAESLVRLSPVAGIRIKNSTSTKLDYILNEVLLYGAEEKFLIFSQSPATLSFIAEALDLVGIKYLEFSGQKKSEHRQTVVTTFETSDLYRVLLMELKHGARGLNLVSASRVIFCEPVWKADVESQAIKRVHRIGQSRQVTVKTLAIRGTSEEVMVARSKALKENKQEFTKEFTEDHTIRSFIEHPTFLLIPTERQVHLDVPLFRLAPPPTPTATSTPVDVTSSAASPSTSSRSSPAAPREPEAASMGPPPLPRRSMVYVDVPNGRPRKKQKTVSFAQ